MWRSDISRPGSPGILNVSVGNNNVGQPEAGASLSWSILPSGNVKIAIENTTFIVDFPIKNGDFP